MIEIDINTLLDITPMNNHIVIKNITDSIADLERDQKLGQKIVIVRNEGNKKREISMGIIVVCPSELFLNAPSERIYLSKEEVQDQKILYDTNSRLIKINVGDDLDSDYYLIRVPDIIGLID